MALLPFPDSEMVEAVAAAVLQVLCGHSHVYSHSLRYLPERSRKELSLRIARVAVFKAWLSPDHESLIVPRQMIDAMIEEARELEIRRRRQQRYIEDQELARPQSPRRRNYEGTAYRCGMNSPK